MDATSATSPWRGPTASDARADPASGARAPKMSCKFVTPGVCRVIEPLLVFAQRLANHVEFVFGEGHAGNLRGSGLAGGCVLLNYRQPGGVRMLPLGIVTRRIRGHRRVQGSATVRSTASWGLAAWGG